MYSSLSKKWGAALRCSVFHFPASKIKSKHRISFSHSRYVQIEKKIFFLNILADNLLKILEAIIFSRDSGYEEATFCRKRDAFAVKEQMYLNPNIKIKQKWSDFISREMLNLLWIFKQNISSLIGQNKLELVCTLQTPETYVSWGAVSPPSGYHAGRQQHVLVMEVTVCKMQSMGRTQPLTTAYFSVRCFSLCLYAFEHAHNRFLRLANFFLPTLDFKQQKLKQWISVNHWNSGFQQMPTANVSNNSGGIWGQVLSYTTAHLSCRDNLKRH